MAIPSRSIGALAVCLGLGLVHASGARVNDLHEADKAYRDGRFEQAINMYEQLLAEDLDSRSREEAAFKLALCQKQLGRYRAAIETFDGILREEPREQSERCGFEWSGQARRARENGDPQPRVRPSTLEGGQAVGSRDGAVPTPRRRRDKILDIR